MTVTSPVEASEFRRLLGGSREAMERVLAMELPDVAHPDLHWHLDPDEMENLASVDDQVLAKRAELFRQGRQHGLTGREITIALLRPHAELVRPTLRRSACGCNRCERPADRS